MARKSERKTEEPEKKTHNEHKTVKTHLECMQFFFFSGCIHRKKTENFSTVCVLPAAGCILPSRLCLLPFEPCLFSSHQRLIYYDYMYNTSNQVQIASIINCRCSFPPVLGRGQAWARFSPSFLPLAAMATATAVAAAVFDAPAPAPPLKWFSTAIFHAILIW